MQFVRRAGDQLVTPDEQIDVTHDQETTSYLLLRLADEYYTLPSTSVREITRWRVPTLVPGAPPVLPGIINQRGVVLPVVNLCGLLGLPTTPPGRTTRYVIAYQEDVGLALLADGVIDLINLRLSDLETVPATLPPQQARLLQGLGRMDNRPVAVLDLTEVIAALRGDT